MSIEVDDVICDTYNYRRKREDLFHLRTGGIFGNGYSLAVSSSVPREYHQLYYSIAFFEYNFLISRIECIVT